MRRPLTLGVITIVLTSVGCGRQPERTTELPAAPASPAAPSPTPEPMTIVRAEPGIAMPGYEAPDLDGNRVRLSGTSDKVRLVNVWATWCRPCRYEIPELVALQEEHGAAGFEVVGVSIDNEGSTEQIRQFVESRGINYTIALDPSSRIADLLSTSVIPTSALVDRDGFVVWLHRGIVNRDDRDLVEALRKALARS